MNASPRNRARIRFWLALGLLATGVLLFAGWILFWRSTALLNTALVLALLAHLVWFRVPFL